VDLSTDHRSCVHSLFSRVDESSSIRLRRIEQAQIHLLLIEDDPKIQRLLATVFEAHGYAFTVASSGNDGVQKAAMRHPDIIIVDRDLPDVPGCDVIQRLREWYERPIVVLSESDKENDKVTMLDLGADDYLTKPFGIGELLARLRVAERHLTAHRCSLSSAVVRFGDTTMDLAAGRVQRNGAELHLTPIEYRLLKTLVKHRGKMPTHRQLLHEVWGPARVESPHYLRIYIRALRKKIEIDPARPRWLLTHAGVGYRLADEA
jgi:two-component system KDP operon response regulator KdpE